MFFSGKKSSDKNEIYINILRGVNLDYKYC